jgi:hypothetical protein
MTRIIILITIFSILSCGGEVQIFNGELVIVEQPVSADKLFGTEQQLNGTLYTVGVCVYDSLIFFSTDKLSDSLFSMFNTKTGEQEYLGIRKGINPEEFIAASYSEQYHVDSSICLWFYDSEKKECSLVDLSTSVQRQIIKLPEFEIGREFPFGRIFVLNDSLLLAFSQGEDLYHNLNLSPPLYCVFNYRTNAEPVQYQIYNEFSYSKKLMPQMCLYSHDRIKPDKTKLAMGMRYLRQINIMDIGTGNIKGYRVKDTPDFNILTKRYHKFVSYYLWICVDDDFIYGAIDSKDKNTTTVDVFDWNGNFLKKLILDKKMANINSIALDPVNKYLYVLTTGNDKIEKVFRYDVNYLYLQK